MAKLLLENILKQKKISKRQFAKRLTIDYSSVFRFFRAGYDPKLSMLERWAQALQVKIEDLFQEERTRR